MPRVRRGGRPKGRADVLAGLVPEDERTPLSDDVMDYLQALQVRAYAETTVSGRKRDLRLFLRWAHARGLVRATDLQKPILVQYQRHLFYAKKRDGRPTTTRSQIQRLSAVRLLCAWLCRSDRLSANPASDLELPRVPPQPPKDVLTAAEAELILIQPNTQELTGLRDRAILEVLYSTGIRRAELASLSIYDVDAARSCLRVVKGKGGKTRTIPIGERALLWLSKYLDECRPRFLVDTTETTLFITTSGEHLSKEWLSDSVRRYVLAAGIHKQGACHLFRHTMATLMLENGADLRYIQAMLGHANLATTQIYTHVAVEKLRQVHAATHPARLLPRRHDDDDSCSL